MSNIYDILNKLKTVAGLDKPAQPAEEPNQPVYESVDAKGSLVEAVKSIESKYSEFKEGREHKDKDSFDANAKVGDTYKTAKGTVTKTATGIKHERGAGKDEEKDDLDEGRRESEYDANEWLGQRKVKEDTNEGHELRGLHQIGDDEVYAVTPARGSAKFHVHGAINSPEDLKKFKEWYGSEMSTKTGRELKRMMGKLSHTTNVFDRTVESAPPMGFGPEDEVQDFDLRADPSKPAYIKKVANDEYNTRDAYDVADPKHPDFADKYHLYKSTNPQGTMSDFIAQLKSTSLNEGKLDDLRDAQAEKDDENWWDKKEKSTSGKREVKGKAYGGSKQADDSEKDDLDESFEDRLAQAREKAAAKGLTKEKDDANTPLTKRTVKGSAYGGSKQADDVEDLDESSDPSFNYRLLSRLQSDCEYFLNHGGRSERNLWAGSVAEQIAKMKELWNSLPEKPEWLSMEDINNYEAQMSQGQVSEVAPPGKKAERMVKGIKKGYAQDGKLTAREKGIAYATAWKAHNKGQVEEESNIPPHSFGKLKGKPDARYSINKEFNGSPKAQHVVRFAGDYVSGHDSPEDAKAAAHAHKAKRDATLEGIEFGDKIKNSQAKMKKVPMKLKEGREVTGVDSVLARFPHEVKNFEQGGELDDDLYNALFDYYFSNGEMPYSVAKARSGDPYQWVAQQLERYTGVSEAFVDVHQSNIPAPTNEVPVSKELDEIAALAGIARPVATAVATQAASNLIDETASSDEVDAILSKVGTGELDAYDVMNNPVGPAQVEASKYLQDKYDDIAIDYRLHPDDQFEEIIDIMCNQLSDDYPSLAEAGAEEESEFFRNPLGTTNNVTLEEEGIEEADPKERDIEYTNTPREKTAGVQAAIPSGTDQSRVKKQYRKEYPGDNHMAVTEDALWKSYQEMLNTVATKK